MFALFRACLLLLVFVSPAAHAQVKEGQGGPAVVRVPERAELRESAVITAWVAKCLADRASCDGDLYEVDGFSGRYELSLEDSASFRTLSVFGKYVIYVLRR